MAARHKPRRPDDFSLATTSVRQYERDREIFQKISTGTPLDKIAHEYKLNIAQVHEIQQRAVRRSSGVLQTVEDARIQHEMALSAMLERLVALWDIPSYKTTPTGVIVRDPHTGQPVEDQTMKIALAGEIRKTLESQRKLHGIDKPVKKVVEVTSVLDSKIEEMINSMEAPGGELDRASGTEAN